MGRADKPSGNATPGPADAALGGDTLTPRPRGRADPLPDRPRARSQNFRNVPMLMLRLMFCCPPWFFDSSRLNSNSMIRLGVRSW